MASWAVVGGRRRHSARRRINVGASITRAREIRQCRWGFRTGCRSSAASTQSSLRCDGADRRDDTPQRARAGNPEPSPTRTALSALCSCAAPPLFAVTMIAAARGSRSPRRARARCGAVRLGFEAEGAPAAAATRRRRRPRRRSWWRHSRVRPPSAAGRAALRPPPPPGRPMRRRATARPWHQPPQACPRPPRSSSRRGRRRRRAAQRACCGRSQLAALHRARNRRQARRRPVVGEAPSSARPAVGPSPRRSGELPSSRGCGAAGCGQARTADDKTLAGQSRPAAFGDGLVELWRWRWPRQA